LIDGKWPNSRKPDTYRYGLLMRDLAISDTVTKEQELKMLTNVERATVRQEYEKELDAILLEAALSQLSSK